MKQHPKADPQFWANHDHLGKVLREQGKDASVEEFRRMQQGHLPPVEKKHVGSAMSYRRWNNLPQLTEAEIESATSGAGNSSHPAAVEPVHK